MASRDAVDDHFQHTLVVLTGIMIEYLNLLAQGLPSAVLCIMFFGLNSLRMYHIGSYYGRKKITTTLHFDYCGKTKFALILRSHRVVLRQLTCQNIGKGEALACAKQDSIWGL